jgi:hypothetical protein
MSNQQRQQLEQQLIEKAMKDQSFRKQLIENPGAAIEAETGWKVPETLKIKVLEEDLQTVYLVLPIFPNKITEAELNNAELESIAGGNCVLTDSPFACSGWWSYGV